MTKFLRLNPRLLRVRHAARRAPPGHLEGLISMNDIAPESARELKSRSSEVPARELVSTLASICEPRHAGAIAVAAQ